MFDRVKYVRGPSVAACTGHQETDGSIRRFLRWAVNIDWVFCKLETLYMVSFAPKGVADAQLFGVQYTMAKGVKLALEQEARFVSSIADEVKGLRRDSDWIAPAVICLTLSQLKKHFRERA